MADEPHEMQQDPGHRIRASERDQHYFRKRPNQRANDDQKKYQECRLLPRPREILKTVIPNRADHQPAQRRRHQQPDHRPSPILQRPRMMQGVHHRRNHSGGRRRGHSHKILRSSRRHSLYVKPREPPRTANQEEQAAHPGKQSKLVQSLRAHGRHASNAPRIRKNRRRHPKTDHVRQRIELHSKLRVRPRHPSDSAIQRIKQNRKSNRLRCMVKIIRRPRQRRHDGVITAQEIRGRERRGNQKYPPPQFRVLDAPLLKRHFLLFAVGHGYDRFPLAVRFASVSAAIASAELRIAAFPVHRASTLDPPFTFCPSFTRISASFGSHTSTREPNRTNPIRSPRSTRSPCLFHETTLRAISPAICLNTISPASVESVNTFCSFSAEARSRIAAKKFPRRYSIFVMVPSAGARFTCTFQTARKMLMRCPGRPAYSSSVTTTTRPSPGDTTAPVSAGMTRSGSRKKEKTNSARSTRTTAAAFQSSRKKMPPSTNGGTPK